MATTKTDREPWSIHAPRFPRSEDAPPASSWWAEVTPDAFAERAKEEFRARMRKSTRAVGQRGIDG
jgi:hypothetical protein